LVFYLVNVLVELQVQGHLVVLLADAGGGTICRVALAAVGRQLLVGALADDGWTRKTFIRIQSVLSLHILHLRLVVAILIRMQLQVGVGSKVVKQLV